jgi:hypothetical protein
MASSKVRKPLPMRSANVSASAQASELPSTESANNSGPLVKIFSDKDYEQEAFEKANSSAGHGFQLEHLKVRHWHQCHNTRPNTPAQEAKEASMGTMILFVVTSKLLKLLSV